MIPTFRPRNSCIAICLFVSGWWYSRTFRPWTHTSDDSYIYQLLLVVATATVSLWIVTTQIRGHIRTEGSSPPSLLRYTPSFLSREGFSTFFPRRLSSNCAHSGKIETHFLNVILRQCMYPYNIMHQRVQVTACLRQPTNARYPFCPQLLFLVEYLLLVYFPFLLEIDAVFEVSTYIKGTEHKTLRKRILGVGAQLKHLSMI